jgi:type II secretory pathway predicted ATPase ExeA
VSWLVDKPPAGSRRPFATDTSSFAYNASMKRTRVRRLARASGGPFIMYEAHFGLRQRPFRPTPDGDAYYPATTHEQAIARLANGIAADEALLLLTGEPGTGKTLLCHRLLERLGPETTTAFVTNSHVGDRTGLLQAILFDLSLPYEGRGQQEMRLALTDFLLKNYGSGRRALVLVDEAQHLGADVLEELRLLGNLASAHSRAAQVILSGQPVLLDLLKLPELTALRQRLAVRAHLEPLGLHEAVDYVVHHLRAVGGRPEALVTDEALALLARGSQGIPRLLNQAAHQALLLACEANTAVVDAEVALEALALLGLDPGEPDGVELDSPHAADADDERILPRMRRPA